MDVNWDRASDDMDRWVSCEQSSVILSQINDS